ncbi:hypothetical protein [Hyphococcus sp.]|uniref:hypothetical protein n=1 Tax=Hyphococcus sp. TaxID=2038636 RepID=UPI0035C78819
MRFLNTGTKAALLIIVPALFLYLLYFGILNFSCVASFFSVRNEQCTVVGAFNEGVWTELVFGVFFGSIVFGLFVSLLQELRDRTQWEGLRETRSRSLLIETTDISRALNSLMLGLNHENTKVVRFRRDIYEESRELILAKIGYMRIWLSSIADIYPNGMLNEIGNLESDFFDMDKAIVLFLSNSDYFEALGQTGDLDMQNAAKFRAGLNHVTDEVSKFSESAIATFHSSFKNKEENSVIKNLRSEVAKFQDRGRKKLDEFIERCVIPIESEESSEFGQQTAPDTSRNHIDFGRKWLRRQQSAPQEGACQLQLMKQENYS